jgi:hypothetical protein
MSERVQPMHFGKSQAKILERTQKNGRSGGRKIREDLLKKNDEVT